MLRKPQRLEPTPAQKWGEAEAEIRAKIAQDVAEQVERDRKKREFYDNLYHSDGSDSSEEEQLPPPPPKKKLRKVRIITTAMKAARERAVAMEEEDDLPIAVVFGLKDYQYVPIIEEELDESTTVAQFQEIFETRSQSTFVPDDVSELGDFDVVTKRPVGQPVKPIPFKATLPGGLPGRITYRRAINVLNGDEYPPNNKGERLCVGSDGRIYAVGKLEKARLLTVKYRSKTANGWVNFGTRYTEKGSKAGISIYLNNIA